MSLKRKPGDVVTVSGTYVAKPDPGLVAQHSFPVMDTQFLVNHVARGGVSQVTYHGLISAKKTMGSLCVGARSKIRVARVGILFDCVGKKLSILILNTNTTPRLRDFRTSAWLS